MKEIMKKLLQELIALDEKKMDGILPPYRSPESMIAIVTLIDELENAIALFDLDGIME